tara:strand:+ start:557 stop:697 length:141 start_codon:yes stop_codon:yes gene_type:complete
MRIKVSLYVGGKTFHEIVYANDVKEAIETAQARNIHAKVIAANPVY